MYGCASFIGSKSERLRHVARERAYLSEKRQQMIPNRKRSPLNDRAMKNMSPLLKMIKNTPRQDSDNSAMASSLPQALLEPLLNHQKPPCHANPTRAQGRLSSSCLLPPLHTLPPHPRNHAEMRLQADVQRTAFWMVQMSNP